MNAPSCTVQPHISLGFTDEKGRLVVLDTVRGIQLLALVCALEAANEPQEKAAA